MDKPNELTYSFAKKHKVLVIGHDDEQAELVHTKTIELPVLAEMQRLIPVQLKLKEVSDNEFQSQLAKFYESDNNSALTVAAGLEESMDLSEIMEQIPTNEDLLDSQDDAPVIRLLNALFTQAIKQKASDIHIETYENRVLVRMRLDGVLQEVIEIQRAIAPLVISRVKVMAKLDIAEKRIPQDGRIAINIASHKIDVRVSTMPSNHGERIVMRILDKKSAQLNLSLLGMQENHLEQIVDLIHQPHGIILVTGPTGSGKTTSLYAMLTDLNEVSRNILTIEDPIEYDLPGIGQTQVNTKVNMTFAKGLRAMLRQDPDVVMVGEIRDLETAEIAVQASLTGHLVLSTLHTNTALGAITRLNDMGVESFLLSSSLIGLIAQRLVRRLCQHCKEQRPILESENKLLQLDDITKHVLYSPVGCDQCNRQGYNGRMGIYEVITIDETLRGMIHRKESQQALIQQIRPTVPSMRQDGFKCALNGMTTIEEVLRVTSAH